LGVDDCLVCVRSGLLIQSLRGAVAVFGVAHIDPPPIESDRVEEFVLAAVGGLHEVTRVEDGRRERVEAGHHEVARQVVGLFDDLAVLVGVEDSIPTGVLVGHLLDEKGGVGANR
jgi:hypothetical protein